MTDFDKLYRSRREKLYACLQKSGLTAAVFEDSEGHRDVSVRYLTGHPGDAVLVLTADGKAQLTPWDENLAAARAHADSVIPYTNFQRSSTVAVQELLKPYGAAAAGAPKPRLALSPATSHIQYEKYCAALPGWQIECSEHSVHEQLAQLRAVKDSYEIACTRKACAITDAMTEAISAGVQAGTFRTETDVALYIERELRAQGCERTSFDTLAAGPARSFAIHAFPGYTAGAWGTDGISLLDYGVCYEGYASDCTITVARGRLSARQEELLNLVQQAADECIALYKPGVPVRRAAEKAQELFAAKGRTMPHSLGHGTGLEIHEAPFISMRTEESTLFQAGNIVTLEPGLYDAELGGTRLENDVLITESGNEILTRSRIFRF